MISLSRESDSSRLRGTVSGFRLRGVVAEREKTFHLPMGTHRLGSLETNELSLPVPGVSRRHALIRVTPGGLEVEDQGSTNGTWIGDRRIERSEISPGEVLRFGPVLLRVEPLDEEETELAIDWVTTIGDGSPPRVPEREESTDMHWGRDLRWLALVERFVTRLGEGDLAAALAEVGEALRADGGCVLEWRRGTDPAVLVGWGRIGEAPSRSAIRRRLADQARSPAAERRTTILVNETQLMGALRFGSREGGVGLVLWGIREDRNRGALLLRTLVSLIDERSQRPAPTSDGGNTAPRRRDPELVFPDGYLPGRSPAPAALYRQMRMLAKGDIQVLIRGETGVGKEQVARILHDSSPRRKGPFLAINCSAIPSELLEAELFGIGKAVATGVEPRAGIFELARGGTLLLDEIGEMPLALQSKLLRVLQEKEIHPVGGKPHKIDVRILAATNADLMARIASGRFRRDFYYRLAGYSLEVPPLRHCSSDIPALVEYFLRVFSRLTGVPIRGLTLKALRLLTQNSWPGNVRELENEIRRLVYRASDHAILDSDLLSSAIRAPGQVACGPGTSPPGSFDGLALAPRVRAFEAGLIREALVRTDGNQTRAAELLELSRNGLVKKMKRLGVRGC